MRMRNGILPAIAVFAACVTVNVYFPEGEIRDLSRQIEDEIRQQASQESAAGEPAEEKEQEDAPQASRLAVEAPFRLAAELFLGSPVWAQDEVPAPEVTNPAIRRIIDSRARRLAQLNRFKGSGVVGENNQALVEVRALDQVTDLRERAAVQRLVKDENADREALFKEMAIATGVDSSQIPRLRTTYAATLREKARAGDWIQMPDGNWRRK